MIRSSHRRAKLALFGSLTGVVVFIVAACGSSDPTPTSVVPPPGPSVTVPLQALNSSGQLGAATLIARGNQTEVAIDIAAGSEGLSQPIHIHQGTCGSLGGVAHALTNLQDGKSSTTVDVSLASLMTGVFSINAHKSADDIGTYVACGDLPLEVALGPLNDSGQDGTATLTAVGNQTQVVVQIRPGASGVSQPIHIHDGSCQSLGGVAFALTSILDGSSETVVDVSLTELVEGDFAINGHKSGEEAGTYIACGDLPS